MHIKKVTRVLLIILLLAVTVIFPLLVNSTAGIAMVCNSKNNYSAGLLNESDHIIFLKLGIFMLLSSVLMLTATVLCLSEKDIPALVFEFAGTVLCFSVIIKLIIVADSAGLTNESFRPLADVYAARHFPAACHTLLVFLISLTDYFSRENRMQRKEAIVKGK